MGVSRTVTADLGKLLESAGVPVYLVDEDCRITLVNQPLVLLCDVPSGDLVGRQCRYHTPQEGSLAERVSAALCPPPQVFDGVPAKGQIHLPSLEGTGQSCSACFIPVKSGSDDSRGVLALLNLPVSIEWEESGEPQAEMLHALIARQRTALRGRYVHSSMLGTSAPMRRVREQIALAGQNRVRVLIVGPPGSGRQHAARSIHYRASGETQGPLVPLSCDLLAAELLLSTIEALAADHGQRSTARQGTLLLNEVDQLPPEVQADLVARLSQHFPLRVVSTARTALTELAASGKFRLDLACELSTLSIEMPPLAERLSDIPLLVQAFLEESNAASSRQLAGFSREAIELLSIYHWPGNLDELSQVVQEAHHRAGGRTVMLQDLPPHIQSAVDAAMHRKRPVEAIQLEGFLREIEREVIERALAQAKGNKTKAARLLGLTRPRLYRRMVQLGLEPKEPS